MARKRYITQGRNSLLQKGIIIKRKMRRPNHLAYKYKLRSIIYTDTSQQQRRLGMSIPPTHTLPIYVPPAVLIIIIQKDITD
jgi:hypothetical protein